MGTVTILEQPAEPRPSPPASEAGQVRAFRGTSYHREQGCINKDGPNKYGPCCPRCDWRAYTCAVCGATEGEVPTDCPRRRMTEEERDGVMGGGLDYIVAEGGWIGFKSTRSRLPQCVEVEEQMS